MLHSSRGRPITAFRPMLGYSRPSIAPDLASVVGLDHLWGAVGQRGGKPADEHLGRLNDMVVDRDQDVLSLPGIRVWQQRHT